VKIKAIIAAIILASGCALVTDLYGQRRRTARPAKPTPKPAKQDTDSVFEDFGDGFLLWKNNVLAFDHAIEGRGFYIYEAAYNATTDQLIFAYVVKFDQTTPAGRSALNTARELAKNFAVYPDQLYYIEAMQYMCQVERKERTAKCYELTWTDNKGNEIAVCPSKSFSAEDNQRFIDTLLADSHVNPEGPSVILKLGDTAKRLWDQARKLKG
jgi:hypothetical protein